MPTPLAQHVILRRASNAVLARSVREQRALARAVLDAGREAELLAFFAPDGHLHAVVGADRAAAGLFARRVMLRIGGDFEPAWIKPVEDQGHLRRVVPYVLGQASHHGVDATAGLEASNLPDLLGLRTLGAYTITTVRTRLPRLESAELRGWMGVGELSPRLDGAVLAEAAAAAACLPSLGARTPATVEAKAAAVAAAGDAIPVAELARIVGVERTTVWRLRERAVPSALVRAVLLQCDARVKLAALRVDRPYAVAGD